VGAVNTWFVLVFLPFAAWLIYLRSRGEGSSAGYFFLCLVPLATGTGLLSAGRRGQLDLLFGAGETRSNLWWFAFYYGCGIPAIMAVAVMWLSGELHGAGSLLQLVAVLMLTAGVSFSTGLLETRYFAGVMWLLLRFGFVLTPDAMAILREMNTGKHLPKPAALAFAALAAPESAINSKMPVFYLLGVALLGLSALVASHIWFITTDFGGKRS
jgi:hypothetical protein